MDDVHRLLQIFAHKVIGKDVLVTGQVIPLSDISSKGELLFVCIHVWNMFMFFTLPDDPTTCVQHVMMHYSDPKCKWTQICKKRNSKSKFIPQLNSRLVRLVPSSLSLIYTCMKINVLVNILKPGESGLKNIPCIWLFMLQSHDFHVLFFASFQ